MSNTCRKQKYYTIFLINKILNLIFGKKFRNRNGPENSVHQSSEDSSSSIFDNRIGNIQNQTRIAIEEIGRRFSWKQTNKITQLYKKSIDLKKKTHRSKRSIHLCRRTGLVHRRLSPSCSTCRSATPFCLSSRRSWLNLWRTLSNRLKINHTKKLVKKWLA